MSLLLPHDPNVWKWEKVVVELTYSDMIEMPEIVKEAIMQDYVVFKRDDLISIAYKCVSKTEKWVRR